MRSRPTAVPTLIRGILYPSIAAAARALGKTPATVRCAMNRGTLDNVGKGRGKAKRDPSKNGRSRPITVAGETWPSMKALSLALGRNRGYVHNAIQKRGAAGMQDIVREVLQMRARAEQRERNARLHIDSLGRSLHG